MAGLCYLSGNAGTWRLLVPATWRASAWALTGPVFRPCEIMAQLPHREIVKVHIATERRIAEIVRGKVKAGDVVVAV